MCWSVPLSLFKRHAFKIGFVWKHTNDWAKEQLKRYAQDSSWGYIWCIFMHSVSSFKFAFILNKKVIHYYQTIVTCTPQFFLIFFLKLLLWDVGWLAHPRNPCATGQTAHCCWQKCDFLRLLPHFVSSWFSVTYRSPYKLWGFFCRIMLLSFTQGYVGCCLIPEVT